MMRLLRLTYMLPVALFACLACLSCSKEPQSWNGPVVELSLECNDPLDTKAGYSGTEDGVDRYNENLISWVDFYFYPGGATSSEASYHVKKLSGKRRSDVFRLEFTSAQVNTVIFPTLPSDTRDVTVFALVNCPEAVLDGLNSTSLDTIMEEVLYSDFLSSDDHRQEHFLMSGTMSLELTGRSNAVVASGTIHLQRYACKMTVGVDITPEVEIEGAVWRPMMEGVEIYMVDAVSNVRLSGEAFDEDAAGEPAYFSYRSRPDKFLDMDTGKPYFDKDGDYYTSFPMYMYPQKWVYGSTLSPEKEPYLKLVVPWAREAAPGIPSTQKQFYYKIVMPDFRPDIGSDSPDEVLKRSFLRNNWYHINIDVGILGAETDESAVQVNSGKCYVFNWQDKNVVIRHAEIGNARYLSVDRENYEIRNMDSVEVKYTTSHPVSIKKNSIRVTRPYFGEAGVGSVDKGGTVRIDFQGELYPAGTKYLEYSKEQRESIGGGSDWFFDNGSAIVFRHPLVNNYASAMFDYSPYTVSFSIVHMDREELNDARYTKDITIVQYPGIFISFTPNPDALSNGSTPDHWGYVYVDNDQFTKKNFEADPQRNDEDWRLDHIWRVVHYSSGGRDMYKINITVLPEDSEFIIGDPRQSEPDSLRPKDNYFRDAPSIEGTTRSLTWYYPTESSDRTVNMMAPSYRISTKLSGIEYGGIPLEQARYRCASFQENGFPAGRWRLPTKAEVRFISTLSAKGIFEWQFGGDYWSANGLINVNRGSGAVTDLDGHPSTKALLRCVYDSWYWEEYDRRNYGNIQVDKEQFTWADSER